MYLVDLLIYLSNYLFICLTNYLINYPTKYLIIYLSDEILNQQSSHLSKYRIINLAI